MRKNSFAGQLIQAFVIFMSGGFIYGLIEVLYRGHTHPSMFVLGGICLLWVGGFNSFFRRSPPFWAQILLGGIFITTAEFLCGLTFNVWLHLHVWDYSRLPLNIMGQICPLFFFIWVAISIPAVFAEDLLRAAFSRKEAKSR